MLAMRLAAIPSVDRILQDPRLAPAIARDGRALVVEELRALLAQYRDAMKSGAALPPSADAIVRGLLQRLEGVARPSLRRVFNLTGTVLHTNLGRALLPQEAIEAQGAALAQSSNLEYDLEAGGRGERDEHVEALLCRITGAEAATAVNNNAGAVLLALNALAAGREVPVSRGELVEIGGSFRIPEIIAAAGCSLREVGTTNRTHLADYERAIGPGTAAILKVHASNYAVVGFTTAPAEAELARLAHARGLPFVVDLGSGSLVELERWGLPAEPTPMRALAAGADLVTFSGDKLLGGPQAGLVVGRRELVARLRRNPMKRALRLDKGRIAALEAVLRLYLDPGRLRERLPTLRLLTRPQAEISALAARLRSPLQEWCGEKARVSVEECASQVGSGSLPVDRLPSAALRISSVEVKLADIARALRALPIPVVGRIHDEAVWLDLRCLEDEATFASQLEGRRL
ncbi:MAG: L-seryl-tRNA(Sec) selenium transferase [Betaproteobacteria bacterium]|nr:L-seryl-tRNA(Sec) selenium transferase [Betaproteobacteria bacterium]MDH5222647.1 L-seryl-tRNA(Sec) selenium transferase [Betaproteobacteria bacterium]